MKIINPATEKVIANLKEDNRESLVRKYAFLKEGQKNWNALSLKKRVKIIRRFSELLLENIESCARILSSEVGKPLQQSRKEINGACRRMDWLLENAHKYLSPETMSKEKGLKEKIVYDPLGVICNISAWNYPFAVGVNVFVPALLAGNAVLYKPSEYATLSGLQIEKYLKKAGVPDNVFKLAFGAGKTGEALLQIPFNGYYFTGSFRTGKSIYEKLATKRVPCQLELGGKDPVYIANDIADIKIVAAGTADGAFYNTGQSCCSVERIYVHKKVYEPYLKAFVREVKKMKVAAPAVKGAYIGPLTRKAQLIVLESQVKDALAKGARLLTGGKRMPGKGYFFEPTVLTNVNHKMLLMKEESFGPVIGIMKVKDDKEALKLMQDTAYGLTAAVYSGSASRAEHILSKINCGTAYWNCCDRVSAALPWSGRNHSGFGSTLSHQGLRAFTQPKAYHLKNE